MANIKAEAENGNPAIHLSQCPVQSTKRGLGDCKQAEGWKRKKPVLSTCRIQEPIVNSRAVLHNQVHKHTKAYEGRNSLCC